jgi:DNA-binding NtrC family response regulator
MKRSHRGKGPAVLLVDEEPLVRWLGADALGDAGFEVIAAGQADEALAVLRDRPDVRVLFTGVELPGSLDGIELARVVHRKWPAIELVITSEHGRPAREDVPEHGRFVAKPYAPKTVIRAIRAATRTTADVPAS